MSPAAKTYVFDLAEDCRLRHRHVRVKNKVLDFSVQVEVKSGNQWQFVVRYDTAHGFAHKDVFHSGGRIEKTPLFMEDYGQALTFAEADLKLNWSLYRDRFLKETI